MMGMPSARCSGFKNNRAARVVPLHPCLRKGIPEIDYAVLELLLRRGNPCLNYIQTPRKELVQGHLLALTET